MKLEEALRSGKRFSRPGKVKWSSQDTFTVEEVLADDWEIERKPREYWVIIDNATNRPISMHSDLPTVHAMPGIYETRVIKVREVIEE